MGQALHRAITLAADAVWNTIVEPSGDQRGSRAGTSGPTRRRRSLPSALTVRIVDWQNPFTRGPMVPRPNRRRVPSGDQLGLKPQVPARPIGLTPLPSGFIRASCDAVLNAIRAPFGDHAGPESHAGLVVSRAKPVPSALMTQMSELPLSITQSNAILAPSGDQAGAPATPMP